MKWWGPTGFATTIQKMDVRPGGKWQLFMHGPDRTDYPNSSIYTQIVRPELIAYEHGGGKKDEPEAKSSVTATFEEVGTQTRLTLRMVFPSPEVRDKVEKEYHAVEGGHQTLDRLADLIANQPAFTLSRA